jgi:hypothetical protein
MTQDQIRAALERVLTWPPGRQEDAVRVLAEIKEQDASALVLIYEQAAEVGRRLADPHLEFLTLDEVRRRFARPRK